MDLAARTPGATASKHEDKSSQWPLVLHLLEEMRNQSASVEVFQMPLPRKSRRDGQHPFAVLSRRTRPWRNGMGRTRLGRRSDLGRDGRNYIHVFLFVQVLTRPKPKVKKQTQLYMVDSVRCGAEPAGFESTRSFRPYMPRHASPEPFVRNEAFCPTSSATMLLSALVKMAINGTLGLFFARFRTIQDHP